MSKLKPCVCGKPVGADCGTARCSDKECVYHERVSHLYWQAWLRPSTTARLAAEELRRFLSNGSLIHLYSQEIHDGFVKLADMIESFSVSHTDDSEARCNELAQECVECCRLKGWLNAIVENGNDDHPVAAFLWGMAKDAIAGAPVEHEPGMILGHCKCQWCNEKNN